MALGMTRTELQRLAEIKYEDAVFLLQNKRGGNAYYLAGYAVELGLKACISRLVQQDTLLEKGLIEKVYSRGHNLSALIGLAGLTAEHDLRKRRLPLST
jgi:HEPN domain-containing protein